MVNVSNLSVGQSVRVVADTCGHNYSIGTTGAIHRIDVARQRLYINGMNDIYLTGADVEVGEPITEPIEFTPSYGSVLRVSHYSGMKAGHIIAIMKKVMIYPWAHFEMVMKPDSKTAEYGYEVVDEDNIAINANIITQDSEWEVMLRIVVDSQYRNDNYLYSDSRTTQLISSIRENERKVVDLQKNMKTYIDAIHKHFEQHGIVEFKPLNIKQLEKLCRKYKVKFNLDKPLEPINTRTPVSKAEFILRFEWNNIDVGNEREGYIKYKKVVIWLTPELKTYRYFFEFNNFCFDSMWKIDFTMHPHISGYICFGNRQSDMERYRSTSAYDFAFDLINESIRSYSPESGPFISINNLKRTVERAEENFKKINKPDIDCPEAWSERAFRLTRDSHPYCRHCERHLNAEGLCTNKGCRACQKGEINCPTCGSRMTNGGWIPYYGKYDWQCINIDCPQGGLIASISAYVHGSSLGRLMERFTQQGYNGYLMSLIHQFHDIPKLFDYLKSIEKDTTLTKNGNIWSELYALFHAVHRRNMELAKKMIPYRYVMTEEHAEKWRWLLDQINYKSQTGKWNEGARMPSATPAPEPTTTTDVTAEEING